MKKNTSKLIACILTCSLILGGCSASSVTGIPGLLYETFETIADIVEENPEGLSPDVPPSDIWTWPDTEEHEEEYDWGDGLTDDDLPDAEDGTVTILMYVNGSTLETEGGYATDDIMEIIEAGYSENVNVVIQTMGTKYWSRKLGIASDRAQTYVVGKDGLELVRDNLGQLDCTKAETLKDFIEFGAKAYPASRNILIMWDHGGGPAYGFGWDEFRDEYENLSLDEMIKALRYCNVHFDFIGMDCCIMSCLEITYALREFCDYMIVSEDFESCLGWYYTDWMKALYADTSISTYDLGKTIIDDMIYKNEKDKFRGDRSILALIDESRMDKLWEVWTEFAYDNEEALLKTNFSQEMEGTGKGADHVLGNRSGKTNALKSDLFEMLIDEAIDYLTDGGSYEDLYFDPDEVYISDYCITDMMCLGQMIDSDNSEKLMKAVDKAILYVSATSDNLSLTGLAVTLPYNDEVLYYDLASVLNKCGFDQDYVEWLRKFCDARTEKEHIDWESWGEKFWNEWGEYESSDIWGEW